MTAEERTARRYPDLHLDGTLKSRAEAAESILDDCTLCPRNCHVNRNEEELGFCKTGKDPVISSYSPHFGEEAPLVGRKGSGTIFFTHCNLGCIFCQNADISQSGRGFQITKEELAAIMIQLQDRGCHNINLVSPSHQVPASIGALDIAAADGLTIPVVYNTGGYDAVPTLRLLDEVIDIYMPDAKYADNRIGNALSGVSDYADRMKEVLIEMHRQVGDLVIRGGIAERGMIIRHLVLPNRLAGTEEVMRFIAEELSKDSYVNVMQQYRPAWKVREADPACRAMERAITHQEYRHAVAIARSYGLWRGIPR
ncbi:MAG: radical SAM protein [Methanocalculus sp. MSAO_Arc1]|uniref:radical SAM protein n=1 Tax=Methanocalculus TaxID=71151 RepID=UPI000FED3CFB|nr:MULTISPECIES: radical SAM protein [unclassified Methanocalculus]MCP1662298.1 putative pyruvate formate lyase activating enzyme [Methanocalculus sp. AMF5]RQD80940.1 MAG: radical SAM protein [Methanocalculus sp. MSAO_Arc1]